MAREKTKTDPTAGVNDSEWDKGFRGDVPDPTPNEAYTVDGVTSGSPTPETATPASDTPEEGAKE